MPKDCLEYYWMMIFISNPKPHPEVTKTKKLDEKMNKTSIFNMVYIAIMGTSLT